MFAADRDLLALHPDLFRDVAWLGQRVLGATVSISGGTLSAAGVDLAALGVGEGQVVLVAGVPVEVLARTGATTLSVCRPRADRGDTPINPDAVPSAAATIFTFAPQIALAHRQILAMLGLRPLNDAGARPDEPGEQHVVNPGDLRDAEACLALHLILSAAAGLGGPESPAGRRAEFFRQRFNQSRSHAAARLDLNGDGVAEAARFLNTGWLIRG